MKTKNKLEELIQKAHSNILPKPELAIKLTNEALRLAKEEDNKQIIADANKVLGLIKISKKNFFEAKILIELSINLNKKLKNKSELANLSTILGSILFNQGFYDQSYKAYLNAVKFYEEIGDKLGLARVYDNLGNLFAEKEQYSKALEFRMKAEKHFENSTENFGLICCYLNIGATFMDMKLPQNALEYFYKAEESNNSKLNKYFVANIYHNIGEAHKALKENEKALLFTQKALEIFNKLQNVQDIFISLLSLASIYLDLGDLKNAEMHLDECEDHFENVEIDKYILEFFQCKSEFFEKKLDFQKAIYFHKKSMGIKEEILQKENAEKFSELQIKYETEKKELESKILKEKNEELNKKNNILDKALKDLQKAQSELIEAGKREMFFATVVTANHELNQPLAVIQGYLDIIKKSEINNLSKETKNNFLKIIESVKKCNNILEKLRDIETPKYSTYIRDIKMINLEKETL
ncbi:MAG: hypothetical protein DWQ06_09985 [Calditrichaeota bacterium]|nr:MAG: hypothetical protein DWQ06_09985 [Calditrichota bacterium]